jgi:hypothetical protein
MKKLLYFLLGLLLILLIGYFIVVNLPKASIKGNEAAFTVTAANLYSEFEKNEAKANQKYIGKTIIVEGVITEIDKDKNGSDVLFLKSDNEINGILCTLEPGQSSDFQINQSIKIKGLSTGFLQDVVLNKGIILD